MKPLILLLASGFGSGYSPFASGTAGSLVAALLYWFVFPQGNIPLLAIVLVTLLISVPVCTKAELHYGKKDDGHIVLDEFAGMWITMLFVPPTIGFLIAGFLLFRLFDVIKPFFRSLQSLPGGWGIMIDDVLAGLLANTVLQAARFFL